MKIMAIDYGDAHTGIAVSDELGLIAGEAWTIDDWNAERLADKITEEIRARNIGAVVLGYPLNMNGTAGPRAEKSLQFAAMLEEKSGIKPVMWDERWTTVDAHRILSENGRRGKRRKKTVDAVAATLILEAYLGSVR